jgi:pimeloyl-ACP methyl ester carboxylesterase
VVGMFDFPHIIERSEILAEVMPKARLQRLNDSAHLPSLDQPEALADAVVSFVRTLDASG